MKEIPKVVEKLSRGQESAAGGGGGAGVRRYFHPHDIYTPGWKYRYDIFTPFTIFSPPHYK